MFLNRPGNKLSMISNQGAGQRVERQMEGGWGETWIGRHQYHVNGPLHRSSDSASNFPLVISCPHPTLSLHPKPPPALRWLCAAVRTYTRTRWRCLVHVWWRRSAWARAMTCTAGGACNASSLCGRTTRLCRLLPKYWDASLDYGDARSAGAYSGWSRSAMKCTCSPLSSKFIS